jgi:hypothetical protein
LHTPISATAKVATADAALANPKRGNLMTKKLPRDPENMNNDRVEWAAKRPFAAKPSMLVQQR